MAKNNVRIGALPIRISNEGKNIRIIVTGSFQANNKKGFDKFMASRGWIKLPRKAEGLK